MTNANPLPNAALQTLLDVLREAKDRYRRELRNGGVSLATREAYEVALVALGGDRVLETIEMLITTKEEEEVTGRINRMLVDYVRRSA